MADKNTKIVPETPPTEEWDYMVSTTEPVPLDQLYLKNNHNMSARETYNKRLIYFSDVSKKIGDYKNVVDFNFAEKRLYGRVNRLYQPMIVSNIGGRLVNVPNTENTENLKVLDFVAENFIKFDRQFRKAIMEGKISSGDKHLSTLKVVKAYENPLKLYESHYSTYTEALRKIMINDNVQITNFAQFLAKLLPYLKQTARKHPFTLPAYVKSISCPMTVSGLVIELAATKPSEDIKKIKEFINSPNWKFYLNAATTYGFTVDRFCPWRLVADIASPPMINASAVNGLTSTDAVLNVCYKKAHDVYYQSFAQRMFNLYNYLKGVSYVPTTCGITKKERMKIVEPTEYTMETLQEKYNEAYMFKLYCTLRFYEDENDFSHQQKVSIIDDCGDLAAINLTTALDTFERILNKPFDYNGSLDYIKKRYDRIDLGTDKK
jgi:hypothetical protein